MTNDYTVKLIKSGFKKQEVEGFSYDERDIDKRICDIVELEIHFQRRDDYNRMEDAAVHALLLAERQDSACRACRI